MRYLIEKFLKPYWKQIVLAISLILVQAMSNLYLPSLNASIINNGVAKGDISYIIKTGGLMLIFTLLLASCAIASSYFGSKISMSFG
ncbi:MAG TPA: ABC transporter ATP-binding protein, partial [Caldisericia bacterium]|nr:ABC transporter ATP-binding protein [Caldisericia bacterium]